MSGKPTLEVLLGGAAGMGPEIIIKPATSRFYDEYCRPAVTEDVRVSERSARICGLEIPVRVIDKVEEADWTKGMPVLDQRNVDLEQAPFASISIENGRACLNILKTTIELYQVGRIGGFRFVPLNEQVMTQAGCPPESEHHYMAHLFGHTKLSGEINVLGNLWTIRTASHIPVSKVSSSLTVDTIMRTMRLANASLKNSGIEKSKLALTALSPRRDEGGKCGGEEIDVIAPAIEKAGEVGIDANGPFPSDILFVKAFNGDFDGVMTMYHDQGQITLKLKGFNQGIIIVGRLPVPAVTCAHGTAYDTVGRGIIKTSAPEDAVKTATEVVVHLKGY